MEVIDRPAQVAAVVAAESAWMPAWQRIVVAALLGSVPGLILLALVPPPGAALIAVGSALGSRAAPSGAARALRGDVEPRSVRRVRGVLVTAYVVTGLLVVAAIPRAWPDPAAVAAAVLALGLVLTQHRPEVRSPHLGVAWEACEAVAAVAVVPVVVLATRGWWQ